MKVGERKEKLHEALLASFNTNGMKQVVTFADIGTTFDNFLAGAGATYSTAVTDLLDWSEQQDVLVPLLKKARERNPGNPLLKRAAQEFAGLEAKYTALAPDADQPDFGTAEKVVFAGLSFENVRVWLEDMLRKRSAVCRIEPQQGPTTGYGTGFLVAPDVLMTNAHVADQFYAGGAPKKAADVVCRFDYEVGADGVAVAAGTEHRLHPTDWRIFRSGQDELDFALLRLKDRAGDDDRAGTPRGHLTPTAYDFVEGEALLIMQHPMGEPLKLALGPVDKEPWGADRVTYRVNTKGGSSGSPCFTQERKVAAIHHYGMTSKNRGVLMSSILAHLRGLPAADRQRLAGAGLAHLLV